MSDSLPSGLVVATPPNASTNCASGSVTATAGASSFSLSSGAQIPGTGSCTVTVDVSAATQGSYVNTIPADALQTDLGNNANPTSATLTVNPPPIPGTFPSDENFDEQTAPFLPSDWTTAASGGGSPWVTDNTISDTAPNSAHAMDFGSVSDMTLDTPTFTAGAGATVSFRHRYNLENTFDGAVLEISINGGAFQDIVTAGGSFTTGGYNGTISTQLQQSHRGPHGLDRQFDDVRRCVGEPAAGRRGPADRAALPHGRRFVGRSGGAERLVGRHDPSDRRDHGYAHGDAERRYAFGHDRALDTADGERRRDDRLHADAGLGLPHRHGRWHLRRHTLRQCVHDRSGDGGLHGDRELRGRQRPAAVVL